MSTEQTADLQSGPGNVSGWDRSAVEALLARSGADATDHELRQVVRLEREFDTARAEVAALTAERDRYRQSLPAETQDYWYWRQRAETAEARVDGQAWADLQAERDRLRDALDAGPDVPDAGLAPLAGTYRQALERAVAANREQTAEVERLRELRAGGHR